MPHGSFSKLRAYNRCGDKDSLPPPCNLCWPVLGFFLSGFVLLDFFGSGLFLSAFSLSGFFFLSVFLLTAFSFKAVFLGSGFFQSGFFLSGFFLSGFFFNFLCRYFFCRVFFERVFFIFFVSGFRFCFFVGFSQIFVPPVRLRKTTENCGKKRARFSPPVAGDKKTQKKNWA